MATVSFNPLDKTSRRLAMSGVIALLLAAALPQAAANAAEDPRAGEAEGERIAL